MKILVSLFGKKMRLLIANFLINYKETTKQSIS